MVTKIYYPTLNIRSKNEFAKHISSKDFPFADALALINQVIKNPDSYWKDSKANSKPGKEVRNARGTPLGTLLEKIDSRILSPQDRLFPEFIFGGKAGSSHIKASKHLLGIKRKRSLLGMDITGFFEKIKEERVYYFFRSKCFCSPVAAKLLAKLCCVPLGEKGSGEKVKTIGRGFATSPRLAAWCSLEIFVEIERLVQKRLKFNDPRIAVYVDDIGITATNVSKETMEKLAKEIEEILLSSDKNQKLPINHKKTKQQKHSTGINHLGLRYERKTLRVGPKTKSKQDKVVSSYNKAEGLQKAKLKPKVKAYARYKRSVINA